MLPRRELSGGGPMQQEFLVGVQTLVILLLSVAAPAIVLQILMQGLRIFARKPRNFHS
jgi:hypothetical protein